MFDGWQLQAQPEDINLLSGFYSTDNQLHCWRAATSDTSIWVDVKGLVISTVRIVKDMVDEEFSLGIAVYLHNATAPQTTGSGTLEASTGFLVGVMSEASTTHGSWYLPVEPPQFADSVVLVNAQTATEPVFGLCGISVE